MRIVVDPDTVVGTRNVTVYLDGTQVVQIPAPPELLAADHVQVRVQRLHRRRRRTTTTSGT